jgi:hypothetical protein
MLVKLESEQKSRKSDDVQRLDVSVFHEPQGESEWGRDDCSCVDSFDFGERVKDVLASFVLLGISLSGVIPT